jgi:LysM repeat protein
MLCRAVRREQPCFSLRAARVATLAAAAFLLLGTTKLGAQEETPRAHTVKRGDTLWDLAKLYLGDSFLWPEIYRLNTDIIDDPHWIYPGEVLKLPAPGATPTVAEAPPVKQAGEPVPTPTPPAPTAAPVPTATGTPVYEPPIGVLDGPTVFPKPRVEGPVSKRRAYTTAPTPAVSLGRFLAAPFVDRKGGPRGAGQILKVVNLSVTVSGRAPKARAQLHDEILVSPPAGSAAPEGEMYITYTDGPYLEDLGQVIVPTGVVQVTRAPRDREAAVAQVVRMFGEIQAEQRLVPYDSTALHVFGRAEPTSDSVVSRVKLIHGGAILPGVQDFVVVDASSRDGVRIGDEFLLFEPRHKSEGTDLADPEVAIARAQVVRVTKYGTTLMITSEKHPNIELGTMARRVATMP